MSIKIYPSRIKQKTNSMNIQLNSLEEKVETEKTNMDEFLSTTSTLKGRAWDSARSYVSEIQQPLLKATDLWIVVQIKANNRYYKAADKLPQVQCLDQSLLERQLRQWEKRLDREYDKENPNENRISRYESMISQINSKLNAIEEFVSKTEGIYNSAVDIQNVLSQANTEINKVSFNPDTQVFNFASVDRQWVHEFGRLRDIEKLKADGLTEEQIKEAEELGFTPEEILVMWEEMKEQEISRSDLESMDNRGLNFGTILEAWSGIESEEDKILISGLLKGNYDEAFVARANEINVNTQLFYTEYMLQTSINCTDEELQAIINEILKQHSDGEARNISSYANSMGYMNMLYTGTTNVLDTESMFFLDPASLNEKQLNEYLMRNEKLMALATTSGAIYDILGEVNKKYNNRGQSVDLSSINIDSLCYNVNANKYTFNIAYKGNLREYNDNIEGLIDVGKIDEVKSVETRILESSSIVYGELYKARRKELESEREAFKAKLVAEIGIAGTSLVIPIVGTGMKTIMELSGQDYSSILGKSYEKGKEKIVIENKKINSFLKGKVTGATIQGIQSWLDNQKGYKQSTKDIVQLDYDMKMSWFGQGGTYTIDGETTMVVCGIYNPVIVERIGIWQREGFEAVAKHVTGEEVFTKDETIDEYEKKEEKEKIEKFLDKLEDKSIEETLWNGGDILGMSQAQLSDGINNLSEYFQEATDKEINIINIIQR